MRQANFLKRDTKCAKYKRKNINQIILNLRTSVDQKSPLLGWKEIQGMREDIYYTPLTKDQFLESIKFSNKSVTKITAYPIDGQNI